MVKRIWISLILGLAAAGANGPAVVSLSKPPPVSAEYLSPWNLAFPRTLFFTDLHANYPMRYYRSDPSLEMVIQGEYPFCRYFSFVAYDADHRPIASIHDAQIAPDLGSVNPFWPGEDFNAPNRRFTLIVRWTAPAEGAAEAGFRGIQSARGNVLYLGTREDGRKNPEGLLGYRRYLPSEGLDEECGVAKPLVYYRKVSDGSLVKPPSPGLDKIRARWLMLRKAGAIPSALLSGRKAWQESLSAGKEPDRVLQWRRSPEAAGENPETVYLIAAVKPDPKQLLLIRWKAPSFPDTYHFQSLTGREDMRYWSLSFASSWGFTLWTLADAEAVIGPDGYVNLVIGFGAPRPAKANSENGYTWVDLKGKPVSILVYRNMVPSPDFPFLAGAVPAGEAVTDQLGEYLPQGRLIAPEELKTPAP